MPHIISINDLKEPNKILKLCEETNEPIIITKNGRKDMVIMSIEAYDNMYALFDILVNIKEAEIEVQEGKVKDAKKSLEELKKAFDI